MRAEPLEPRRVRYPKGAYGWVDLRIVTEGHLRTFPPSIALVYLFLCTVGNRDGISFWSKPRMAHTLNLPLDQIDEALQALSAAGLIAVACRIVQVLPIPARGARPSVAPQTTTNSLPPLVTSSSTQPCRELTEDEIRAHEAQARAQIARFCGTREPSAGVLRAVAKSLALKERP